MSVCSWRTWRNNELTLYWLLISPYVDPHGIKSPFKYDIYFLFIINVISIIIFVVDIVLYFVGSHVSLHTNNILMVFIWSLYFSVSSSFLLIVILIMIFICLIIILLLMMIVIMIMIVYVCRSIYCQTFGYRNYTIFSISRISII